EAQEFVTRFQKASPAVWRRVTSQNRDIVDAWDAKMRLIEDPVELQRQMDSLEQQFAELEHNSILERSAFIPAHPQPIAYITANFLHGGWLHIIGNMWFLWLCRALSGGHRGAGI